jgi:site-specific recombinase XerD
MMHPTAAAEKSDATKRAYRSDFEHFAGWCNSAGRTPLPGAAETVAAYLALLAEGGLKSSTIRRRCAGIAWAHRLEDLEPPTGAAPVKAVLRRSRRREAWRG